MDKCSSAILLFAKYWRLLEPIPSQETKLLNTFIQILLSSPIKFPKHQEFGLIIWFPSVRCALQSDYLHHNFCQLPQIVQVKLAAIEPDGPNEVKAGHEAPEAWVLQDLESNQWGVWYLGLVTLPGPSETAPAGDCLAAVSSRSDWWWSGPE